MKKVYCLILMFLLFQGTGFTQTEGMMGGYFDSMRPAIQEMMNGFNVSSDEQEDFWTEFEASSSLEEAMTIFTTKSEQWRIEATGNQLKELDVKLEKRKIQREKDFANHPAQRLRRLSTALESYAVNHQGYYPQSEEELLNDSETNLEETFCGQVVDLYRFECTFGADGYEITATFMGSNEGDNQESYKVTTYGQIESYVMP